MFDRNPAPIELWQAGTLGAQLRAEAEVAGEVGDRKDR